MTRELEPGQWVSFLYEDMERSPYRDQYGYRQFIRKTKRGYARVVAIEGDRATLESWEMARITRRVKAFGQRVDHTAYRVGGTFVRPLADLTQVIGGLNHQLQQKLDNVMRYPTKGARDYARAKRRKEAARAS